MLTARLEEDGVTITVGQPEAPHTIRVFEEPSCPFCRRFEAAVGPKLTALAALGSVRIQYTVASFLDDRRGDDSSRRAAAALRAALERGKFPEFRAALMASGPADHTPRFLRQIADTVPGLNGPGFQDDLRNGSYETWAANSQRAFANSGHSATPTVLVDGRAVHPDVVKYDVDAFTAFLADSGIS
ncbi:DsbA family protein [Streptomyces sp. NPDC050485]|uniref:DsbA family protein n=1 Tax=Streptomyces sp. NPDC050485 TaxID=3365617 RepID=UPI00379F57E8